MKASCRTSSTRPASPSIPYAVRRRRDSCRSSRFSKRLRGDDASIAARRACIATSLTISTTSYNARPRAIVQTVAMTEIEDDAPDFDEDDDLELEESDEDDDLELSDDDE